MKSRRSPRRTCVPDDLLELRLAASPVLSPKGGYFVILESVASSHLDYDRELWHISAQGVSRHIAIGSGASCSHMALSNDGKYLAIAMRSSQGHWIEVLDTEDFKISKLSQFEGVVTALEWIDHISFMAVIDIMPADELTEVGDGSPIRIEWINYKKDGRRGFLQPESELWLCGIDGRKELLRGFAHQVSFLLVEKRVAYLVLESRHDDSICPQSELWSLDLDRDISTLRLRTNSPIDAVAVTDVSQQIVVVAPQFDDFKPPVPRLWCLDNDGSARIMFESDDIACESTVQGDSRPGGKQSMLRKISGSDEFLFIATVGGDATLLKGSLSAESAQRLIKPGWSVSDFSTPTSGKVGVTLESSIRPIELFEIDCDSNQDKDPVQVSNFNRQWLSEVEIVGPESVEIQATDGRTLFGYFCRAAATTKSPLLVKVHGGPHLCYGSRFDLETQIAIGHGFCVLLPNLRGSSGMGTTFRSLSVGEWGGMDYEELIDFVDFIAMDDSVDSELVFIQGASYGGYLTNWAVTRTKRFRAAVSERSVSNLVSKFGTADNGFTTNKLEMSGADIFDEGLNTLIERSPLFYVPNISTPMLLIHGEDDYRCPVEQSEQLFTALRRVGKEATFVRFPGESHSLSYSGRPDHRIGRLSLIFSWFNDHHNVGENPVTDSVV